MLREGRMKSYFAQAEKLVPDVLAVLTAPLVVAAMIYLGEILASAPKLGLVDYIQMLTLPFIAGSMGVAIWVHKRKEDYDRSSAYLNNATALVNRARQVLTNKDGSLTNDRVSWVTAARLIMRAEMIVAKISFDAHKVIFEAEHDYQRHTFGGFLKHDTSTLPASFFCGSQDLNATIGQAVYDPSQAMGGQKWIPPRVVAVVYRFFQYPAGYEDPLDSSKLLSEEERDRLWLFGQKGVCDYLVFRENFFQ